MRFKQKIFNERIMVVNFKLNEVFSKCFMVQDRIYPNDHLFFQRLLFY